MSETNAPLDPQRSGSGPPEAGAPRFRLRLAGLDILWERIWPARGPVPALSGLFLVLALADLFRRLRGWLHAALLAAFAGGILWALGRLAWRLRRPGVAAARRRLERASGLAHRPLTALADRLAGGGNDPQAAALWEAHRTPMAAATGRLRVGPPAARLAAVDPVAPPAPPPPPPP